MRFSESAKTSSSRPGEEDCIIGDLISCVVVIMGESTSSWRKSGSRSGTLKSASSYDILRFRTGSCPCTVGEIIQEEGSARVGV